MIGNVVLHRGANVVRGGRLLINLNNNAASLDGGGSKVGTTKSGGRVTGVFSVENELIVPKKDKQTE